MSGELPFKSNCDGEGFPNTAGAPVIEYSLCKVESANLGVTGVSPLSL